MTVPVRHPRVEDDEELRKTGVILNYKGEDADTFADLVSEMRGKFVIRNLQPHVVPFAMHKADAILC